ncbi:unnamed protein product [Dibothriocephalus latus]|uniref:Uncharacterized protein n=1 Tax=Dibothriocephalus latus TaxID=60516 RepID=A0A3P6RDD4_DIBLA|nr:unnamed protein product [Dibothriocephalus latus]
MRDKNGKSILLLILLDPSKLRHTGSSKPTKKATESKEAASVDFELPIQPDPTIPHMSELEPEKLEWMRDLPPIAKTGPSVSVSASNKLLVFLRLESPITKI